MVNGRGDEIINWLLLKIHLWSLNTAHVVPSSGIAIVQKRPIYTEIVLKTCCVQPVNQRFIGRNLYANAKSKKEQTNRIATGSFYEQIFPYSETSSEMSSI